MTAASDVAYRLSADAERVLEVWGLERADARPRSMRAWLRAYVHGADRGAVEQAVREAREHARPFEVEHRVLQPDGASAWARTRAVPSFSASGTVEEWIGVTQDITSRREAETALGAAAARDAFRLSLTDALRRLDDPMAIQDVASTALARYLDASCVSYADVDAEKATVTFRSGTCGDAGVVTSGTFRLADFGGSAANEILSGRTVVTSDVNEFPQLMPAARAAFAAIGVRAGICVPLFRMGRMVGVMAVYEPEPRPWTDDEVALVEEVAERCWGQLERVRAERELRQSEEKYRSLFSAIDEAFSLAEIVTDPDGTPVDYRILEVNPAFERMTGIPADEAVGRTGRELVPELEGTWIEAYGKVALEGESIRFSDRVAGLDRWFDVYAFPRGDGVFAAIFRDVTAERRAQAVLRELTNTLEARVEERTREVRDKEERFRRLVEASAATVWTALPDGTVAEDSPSWRAFTGQSLQEWLGDGWIDAVHPNDRQRAVADWARSVATGRMHDVEFRVRHATTGTYRWISVRAVPLRGADGEITGWIGMDTDIDDRKRSQDRVRELAARLTAAEQNERRRIATVIHDELQQMLHGVELKLASVARKLHEPTAPRSGRGELAAEVEEARAWIRSGVRTARELSVELSPFVLQQEDMRHVLAWLANHVEEMHGLEVRVDASGSFPVPDEELRILLYQVVRELLFNVVKHADVERATIVVRDERGWLSIEVRDEGKGFDPAGVASRLDARTGFGLFSIRERVGVLGGRLEIASEPGGGTRATVLMPLPGEVRVVP